jgi:hypothetical protein
MELRHPRGDDAPPRDVTTFEEPGLNHAQEWASQRRVIANLELEAQQLGDKPLAGLWRRFADELRRLQFCVVAPAFMLRVPAHGAHQLSLAGVESSTVAPWTLQTLILAVLIGLSGALTG